MSNLHVENIPPPPQSTPPPPSYYQSPFSPSGTTTKQSLLHHPSISSHLSSPSDDDDGKIKGKTDPKTSLIPKRLFSYGSDDFDTSSSPNKDEQTKSTLSASSPPTKQPIPKANQNQNQSEREKREEKAYYDVSLSGNDPSLISTEEEEEEETKEERASPPKTKEKEDKTSQLSFAVDSTLTTMATSSNRMKRDGLSQDLIVLGKGTSNSNKIAKLKHVLRHNGCSICCYRCVDGHLRDLWHWFYFLAVSASLSLLSFHLRETHRLACLFFFVSHAHRHF